MECAVVFPSDTVTSIRLFHSASIFTAEVSAIIKALDERKDLVASRYIMFTDTLSCLQILHYMKLEHPLIGIVIRRCVLNYANKEFVVVVVVVESLLEVTKKADFAAKSARELPRAKVGVPYNVLNIVSANIFCPVGKMIGTERS